MKRKLFANIFFTWLVVLLLLLSPITLVLQSMACEATSVSGVLGRTIRLDTLCDDFEDANWHCECQNDHCSPGFWRGGSGRGVPELLKIVDTPKGGKNGSTRALEIRTNMIDRDNHPDQEDLLTADFEQKLGHKLTRADQPVFIVRIWLPPFDQWGDKYCFGFRHESFLENGSPYNYSSIFLDKRQGEPRPFFKYRSGTNKLFYEVYDPRPIEQAGWWTLAVAFDKNGFDHYYARPGVGDLTEEDRMFDATQLFYNVSDPWPVEQAGWKTLAVANQAYKKYPGINMPTEIAGIKAFDAKHLITKKGKEAFLINYFKYSFFSLMYPSDGNESPQFIIDDYEVWVVK